MTKDRTVSKDIALTRNAVAYAWRELGGRVGVKGSFESIGISVYYCDPAKVRCNGPSIVVAPCGSKALEEVVNGSSDDTIWVRQEEVLPAGHRALAGDKIPFLLWGEGYGDRNKPAVEMRESSQVVFNADIVASTVFMLSRLEEIVIPGRDAYGRFLPEASIAYRRGFLNRPIIDEYALILRAWLEVLVPGWKPNKRTFKVKLGHDIDLVRPFSDAETAVRTIVGHILKRKSLSLAWNAARDACYQVIAPEKNSIFRGIYDLAQESRKHGIESAFYFMAAEKSPQDSGYDLLQSWIRQSVIDLRKSGFEIGFHAGYETFDDVEKLAAEKHKFESAVGKGTYGGRQHYCRFKVPDTWRHLEKVGISYDASMGYPQKEGFRCGTCHPFRPFDIEHDREMDILEYPFIAMDGTFTVYRHLTHEEAEECILKIAERCRRVEGIFSLVWHNDMLTYERRPWIDMYKRVIGLLARMQAA